MSKSSANYIEAKLSFFALVRGLDNVSEGNM